MRAMRVSNASTSGTACRSLRWDGLHSTVDMEQPSFVWCGSWLPYECTTPGAAPSIFNYPRDALRNQTVQIKHARLHHDGPV